jgi:hypothetical protein
MGAPDRDCAAVACQIDHVQAAVRYVRDAAHKRRSSGIDIEDERRQVGDE